MSCEICPLAGQLACSACRGAFYCSRQHQRQHWRRHKPACRLLALHHNITMGRYLAPARGVAQGELLLRERPLVVGPIAGGGGARRCLGCSTAVSGRGERCDRCGLVGLCGRGCEHVECEFLKGRGVVELRAELVVPLRCLLLRGKEGAWQALLGLESHLEERRGSEAWLACREGVETPLRQLGLLSDADVEGELVQCICGILDVNSFEIGAGLRALYLRAAMVAHSCAPNLVVAVDHAHTLYLRAGRDLEAATPLLHCYTGVLDRTEVRRAALRRGKYFECACARCVDPTELGTELSTVRCPACKEAAVRMMGGAEGWVCTLCGQGYAGGMIKTCMHAIEDAVEETDKTDPEAMEALLSRLWRTLHPQHSFMLDLKQTLASIYTQLTEQPATPSRKRLQRRLELCREILPALEALQPGLSRLKAMVNYNMHGAIVQLASLDHRDSIITSAQWLERLLGARQHLDQSVAFFRLCEPPNSQAGQLANQAAEQLDQLDQLISSVATNK